MRVTPEEEEIILSLLTKHIPGREVWAIGSRVTGKCVPGSDLDLVVFGEGSSEAVWELRMDLEDSDLPWCVDLVEYRTLPPWMKRAFHDSQKERIFPPPSSTSDTPSGDPASG
jgi:type I restriction enzyme S subunit